MTACSFAVSAHVFWNWAARAARTAIPLFILGRTLSTCRSLDMRRLGSIRRFCRAFVLGAPGGFGAFIFLPSHRKCYTGSELDEPGPGLGADASCFLCSTLRCTKEPINAPRVNLARSKKS